MLDTSTNRFHDDKSCATPGGCFSYADAQASAGVLEWHTEQRSDPAPSGMTSSVSRQLDLNGRCYRILSEPHGAEWKAVVVELIDAEGEFQEPIGIEAAGETRGAADAAAERKLRRLLKTSTGSLRP